MERELTFGATGAEREAAWTLVCRHVQEPGLRRHMLAVETAMRAYARKLGEDESRWGVTGLLHDFDWESICRRQSIPNWAAACSRRRDGLLTWCAIRGHATYLNVPRDTPLAKALFACDELTGFIGAVVAVRPNKTIREVTVDSVRKKLKDKRFAAKVDRDEVDQGAKEFDVDLDEHIAFLIAALTANSEALGI